MGPRGTSYIKLDRMGPMGKMPGKILGPDGKQMIRIDGPHSVRVHPIATQNLFSLPFHACAQAVS